MSKKAREARRAADRAARPVRPAVEVAAEPVVEPVMVPRSVNPGGGRRREQWRWTVPLDDLSALAELSEVREKLEVIERERVVRLRGSGVSWGAIGEALRVTGEGARRRHGERG